MQSAPVEPPQGRKAARIKWLSDVCGFHHFFLNPNVFYKYKVGLFFLK